MRSFTLERSLPCILKKSCVGVLGFTHILRCLVHVSHTPQFPRFTPAGVVSVPGVRACECDAGYTAQQQRQQPAWG